MNQQLRYALKLFGERMFFNLLSLIMIPVFIPIIGSFSIGPAIFSIMVCSLYIGIAFDMIWKLGRHDRQSYATEKHYRLKGMVVAALSELPFLLCYILLLFNPGILPFYRVVCIGTYMGFVPQTHVNAGYGLVLLIMPVFSAIAYLAGYKKPNEEKEKLSHKIMYKKKERE